MKLVAPPIRFQISVLLLVATLNTVLLFAGTASLFAAVLASPSRQLVSAVASFERGFSPVQIDVLTALSDNTSVPSAVLDRIKQSETLLSPAGQVANNVREDLVAYHSALEKWNAHVLSPAHLPIGGIEDVVGQRLKRDIARSNDHTISGARHLVYYTRPRWVDAAQPFMPFAGAWVLACSLVTVILAGGLRVVLSRPLERLTLAARAISQGQFDAPIPAPEGAAEIQMLAIALRAARSRTIETIDMLDVRTRQNATMLAELADGVVLADQTGTVVESNAQAEAMLAMLSPKWKTSRSLPEIVDEIQVGWFAGEIDRAVAVERVLAGRKMWFEVSLCRVEHAGQRQFGAWVVVFHDVTHAREVENIKRDFMSVMTHELKTPLVTIEGFAKLLLMNRGGDLSEKQRNWVQNIRDQGQVLLTMVTNLLDATRIEGGNLTISAESTSVAELYAQWCTTWRPVVEQRGLTFRFAETDVGSARIAVDSFRMQQVIGNLLNNALKFTKAPGEVGISLCIEGGTAQFTVFDTGRGIPADAIPHLFEKFYQVEKGDTRVAGGAGLGLYIVYQLVQAQRGRVEVHSAVGQGSRFVLSFPLIESGGPNP